MELRRPIAYPHFRDAIGECVAGAPLRFTEWGSCIFLNSLAPLANSDSLGRGLGRDRAGADT